MVLMDSPALVVLDDHELVRDGMERQLTTDFPGARVVYSGDSLLDALKATSASTCDCAVVDLDLGDQTPVAETVSAFTARGIPVVVVSAMARPDVLQAAMAAGAQAFIAKRKPDAAEKALAALIRRAREDMFDGGKTDGFLEEDGR